MKFKQLAAGILAASMVLGALSACSKQDTDDEEPTATVEPEQAETPDEAEATEPDTTAEEPEQTIDLGEETTREPVVLPEGAAAVVKSTETAGDVEELFSYDWTLPQVAVPDADAEADIQAYYDGVATKYNHYATGELFDEAVAGAITGLSADYTVTLNRGNILSVRRELREGAEGESVTIYAETFNTDNGGLLVASDFFDGDEDTWTAQLIEQVTAQLDATGLYANVPLWEDTLRQSFDRDSFYLTETAYVVFYPAGTLSSDPIEVAVPYEALDLFHLPE